MMKTAAVEDELMAERSTRVGPVSGRCWRKLANGHEERMGTEHTLNGVGNRGLCREVVGGRGEGVVEGSE